MELTTELLEDLVVGDVIETSRLFPGMSDEKLLLELKSRRGNARQFKFRATFMGIFMDCYTCDIVTNGDVSGIEWFKEGKSYVDNHRKG